MAFFHHVPVWLLSLMFTASAALVWCAGAPLADSTSVLSERFKLGEALGGLILLAIVTDLPEVAIMAAAALNHDYGIATGNLLGGVAMQTVVLVILDFFGKTGQYPLSSHLKSLAPVLEGTMVVALLGLSVMASRMPSTMMFAHISPGILLITVFWVMGIYCVGIAKKKLPWEEKKSNKNIQAVDHDTTGNGPDENPEEKKSTAGVMGVFAISALVTFMAGVVLEETGNQLAGHFHMGSVIFGATILAAVTALPEITTGLASVKLREFEMAVSDILGGNAFLPVIFLIGTLISGDAILPHASNADLYLAALGIVLTTIFMFGALFRNTNTVFKMGWDSLCIIVFYLIGIVGLCFVKV